MQRELESRGMELPLYCTQQIEQMVSRAMLRMQANRVIDHAGHVLQAERNLVSLIEYFCEYSREIGSYPRLSNSDFDAALHSCPSFWPYSSSG